MIDDPELDGTDFAHPAYWRGYERAVETACYKINEILDGKDSGHGCSQEPWESTRRRLLEVTKNESNKPAGT